MSGDKKENNLSKSQIVIAVIGLVGVLVTALLANIDKLRPDSKQNQTSNVIQTAGPTAVEPELKNTPRKIVIMDNNLLTYDKSGGRQGRTNHDDISDALRGLNVTFVTLNTNLQWVSDEKNYAMLSEAKPDLIIIHVSAFSNQTDPNDTGDNFRIFLHSAMPSLPTTKLLVYSRAFSGVTTSEVERYASTVRNLRQRTSFFKVNPGASGKYFNDTQVSNALKEKVETILNSP